MCIRDRLEVVRAIEQRCARFECADHALVGTRLLHDDLIAAGQFAFLAARKAEQRLAFGHLDSVLPSVGGDDGARDFQMAASASILAAQMKSLRDRPPTSCVL